MRKTKELMEELYNQNKRFLLELIASLINEHNCTYQDNETRLRQLYLMEAYILEQQDSEKKDVLLRNINRAKKIFLNDMISNQLEKNEGKRYFLLWGVDEYRDADEWCAICLSRDELQEQIIYQRKRVEAYDDLWRSMYSEPTKLQTYEYIPKVGFRKIDLEGEMQINYEICV